MREKILETLEGIEKAYESVQSIVVQGTRANATGLLGCMLSLEEATQKLNEIAKELDAQEPDSGQEGTGNV